MTFQRAPPEVNGFGVITWTPGLTRSSQPLMCFGLPLRTTKTTTESETMPLCAFAAQFFGDEALADEQVDVRGERERDEVGGWPAATARAWSPEAP